ncbi:hypothetical protein GCM10010191_89080 [Actinomadura vinacea]|uniref:Uncharacterized protein n=1 Tax=Actinomadura vinacea TaxID=115336 RepID=A0ABN3KCM0_9ACTN
MARSPDPTRRQISTDLRRIAQARRHLALQHPEDHEIYEAEARAYENAAAIVEGDTSMVRVLTAHASTE